MKYFINQELFYLDKLRLGLPHSLQDLLQKLLTRVLRSDEESLFRHFLADAVFPKFDPNLPLHFDFNLMQLNFNLLQFLSLDNLLGNPLSLQLLALTSMVIPKIE